MKSSKPSKRQTSIRSQGKVAAPFWNDENDRVSMNTLQTRKSAQHKNSSFYQSGLKQRAVNQCDIKQLNNTLDKKQADLTTKLSDDSLYYNCLKKKTTSKKIPVSNQFQLQNNLDTLSQILQTQKRNEVMSFGLPEEKASRTLEIKTEMAQLLRKHPSTSKERRVIEIPKYLYGFTCETRATEPQESMLMPSNVMLEKRSGGDYFKFDFKNQKKQQLPIETAKHTPPKNQIVDALIEDTAICEEFSRDFCQDISYLTQQVVEDVDDSTKTEKFKELYKGAYAAVRQAVQLKTNRKVAIKVYEKAKVRDLQRRKGVRREIKLLQKLNHQNIVKILDTIESNNHINIILEYVGGCSLHSFLKKQQDRRLSEDQCRPLFHQIVNSIAYLHSKSICHRDIKLENILLDESQTIPKLIDFGFSTCFPLDRKVKMFCGTPSYMAPEIVNRLEYRGDKADVWALGVVFFALTQGYFPFKGSSDAELYKRISSGSFECNVVISENAKALLASMLAVDPEQRPSASDLLKQPWLKMPKKARPQIAEITLDQSDKGEDILKSMQFITPTNQQRQFDFNTQPKVHSSYLQNQIMKKHLGVHSPFSQKVTNDLAQQFNRLQYYTTTNAMMQSKVSESNQFYFKASKVPQQQNTSRKLSRTQPEVQRQKTHSYCLNSREGDQLDHHAKPSYDSDAQIFHSLSRRGYSPQQIVMKFQDMSSEIGQMYQNLQNEKRRHLLTIYPSYVPSDKSLRSPSNEMIAKLQQKSRELSRERSKEHTRVQSQPRQND